MYDRVIIIRSLGVDWVTITSKDAGPEQAFREAINDWRLDIKDGQYVEKNWGMLGYRGFQVGPVRFGVRSPGAAILMVSGEDSEYFSTYLEPGSVNCTRFDLQVTVAIDPPDPFCAERLYKRIMSERHPKPMETVEKKRSAPPLRYISSETGDTFYHGTRNSEAMLRFYDKSKDFGNAQRGSMWRYEVQYTRKKAKAAWEFWRKATNKDSYTMGQVTAEFHKAGVSPMFQSGTEIKAIEIAAEKPEVEQRLSWISRCVAPVVTQLFNAGYERQVLHALRLHNVINHRISAAMLPDDGMKQEILDSLWEQREIERKNSTKP